MPKKQIDLDVLWFILHGILHTWHTRMENERNLTQDESPFFLIFSAITMLRGYKKLRITF